jgi:hypothetical protein
MLKRSLMTSLQGEQILLYATRFFWFHVGLNLEMTTDLICMHKLEKGTRAQLIGRAQRRSYRERQFDILE